MSKYRLEIGRGEDSHGPFISRSVRHEDFQGGGDTPIPGACIEGLSNAQASEAQRLFSEWADGIPWRRRTDEAIVAKVVEIRDSLVA
jgi:hypothetical protein